MNLATEATNANGNAIANQQKYIESLEGKIQSLKTEFSALWIGLLDSDSIKSLVDSVKEMVTSLEDGTTGLKPAINLLAKLLEIISKIISIVPTGGLVASILGLKFGKSLLDLSKGLAGVSGKLKGIITLVASATKGFSVFGTTVKNIFMSNPIGVVITVATTIWTLIDLITESAEEAQQKYKELAAVADESKRKLDSINEQLKTQKELIDDLSSKHLSYVEKQDLAKAKEMTAELERQRQIEEDAYRISIKNAAEQQVKAWKKEGYDLNDVRSTQFALDNLPLDPVEVDRIGNQYPALVSMYLGIGKYTDEVIANIKTVNDYLNDDTSEAYYEYLTTVDRALDSSEQSWLDYYEWLRELRDEGYKRGHHDEHNQSEVDKLFNNEELDGLISQLATRMGGNVYRKDLLGQILNEETFAPLRNAIFNMDLASDVDVPMEEFRKGFISRYEKAQEEIQHEIKPIDLATWLSDKSTIDSEKTWDEIIDAYETGLNSLGDLLNKWQSGNEVIEMKDIFDVTDVTDSIFSQFGMPAFQSYLQQAGEDIGAALANYIQSSYETLINNIDDPGLIENFDIVTEKLQKLVNVAKGGANDVDKLAESYEELIKLYNQVSNGETLKTAEAARLIDKYDALQDAVQIVGDEYSFEKDAIKTLINQYIELQNTSVSAEITRTKNQLENTKARLKAYGVEVSMLKEVGIATILASRASAQEKQALAQLIGQYLDAEGDLKELEEAFDSLMGDRDKYKDDSSSEIDWIANSLENLARKAEEARTAYDHLWSTAGSSKAVTEANKKLTEYNNALEAQAAGFNKAAVSYQKELDKLGLSAERLAQVRNVALGNEAAWGIEKFSGDSTEYDKYNKAIDLYKKIMDNWKSAADTRHTILENEIQKLQNLNDMYNNSVGRYEAQLALATRARSAQKIYDQMRESQDAQYAVAIEIARLKGDEIEAEKLLAEWAQKTNETIAEKRQFAIDAVITRYDRVISEFENRQAVLEHGATMIEKRGYMANENYYRALIDNEITTAQKLLNERENLVGKLRQIETEGIASKEDLDQWWELKNQIDSTTQSLYESEEAIQDWQNAIDDLRYDVFNRIQDAIAGVNTEAEFLINLFRNDDLFKSIRQLLNGDTFATKIYQGGYSDEGLAVLGLHQAQLKTNAELAENYANELEDINKKLQDDPANVKLLDRRNELLEAQRNSIEAVESEKDAILDLVREGYDKQLESLETLSSKYMEVLNTEKDIYEYNKNISKQTKNISTLRKRMASLVGDNSEEARSRIQQLTVQLQEAEDNLRDTQYDRYISDQQNLLDQMYKNFEGYFNEQMENRDARLKEIEVLIDNNFSNINNILTGAAGNAGTNITGTMNNIWSKPLSDIDSIQSNIATTDTNIKAVKNSTTSIDGNLKNYINNYDLKLKNVLKDKDTKIAAISEAIDSLNTNFSAEGHLYTSLAEQKIRDEARSKLIEELTDKIGDLDSEIKIPTIEELEEMVKRAIIASKNNNQSESNDKPTTGVGGVQLATTGNFYRNAVVASDFYQNGQYNNYRGIDPRSLEMIYNSMYNDGGYLKDQAKYGPFKTDEAHYKIMYQWLKKRGYVASGARHIKNSDYYWTQEKGLEAIIRPSDGAILTPLSRGDSVLNAGATQNIWDMANNPIQFIKDNLSFPINLPTTTSGGNFDIQQSMAITLPNVQNYSEFVTALQNDKKFERMLQDMTVNQLTNKNALAKYKYKY